MHRRLKKELSFVLFGAAFLALALRRPRVAGYFGLAAAALPFIPTGRRFSFRHRHVLITGGSRGLGLGLAQKLAREGAVISLVARDPHELSRAKDQLLSQFPEAQIAIYVCDVTDPLELEFTLREVHADQGRIEVVFNNAGAITAGPFEVADEADFHAQVDLHLHAIVHMTRILQPYFRAHGGGRIVNISSLGGAIGIPHMAAYTASKFALSGFSRAVATELKKDKIIVTTIYPGLVRTGSAVQAVFKGAQEKEFAVFALSNLTVGFSMSTSRAAKQVIEACRHGDHQAILGASAKFGHFAFANFPEITAVVLGVVASLLPRGTSQVRLTGAQSRQWFDRQAWTWPWRALQARSEKDFNQLIRLNGEFNLGV